jgi:lysozyme
VGITDASGHRVARYRDNPQPLERCLEVFVWLLTTRYLPAVLAVFGAFEPNEHQLAAALSFHYNTGAVARASWLRHFLAGEADAARRALLAWRHPPEVMPRRRRERDLFFDAQWAGDGTVAVYEVAKPGYRPVRPRRVEVDPLLAGMLGSAASVSQVNTAATPLVAALAGQDLRSWFDRLFS